MYGSDDKALVERARQGNRQAVDQLLAISYPALLRTARALLGNVDDAQDAAQEAALAVFENLHQLKEPEAFVAWSNTVVRRACSKYLRHRQRNLRRTVEFDESSADHGHASNDRLLEARAQLAEILGQAGESMTAILIYRLALGLSVRETATVLGVSEGAVKLRLFRARRKVLHCA